MSDKSVMGRKTRLSGALAEAAGYLKAQGNPAAKELAALADKLREERFQIVVMGEFKRGKSTLINALAGNAVLPMGAVPLTSVVTVVRHAASLGAEVEFLGGKREPIPIERVAEFVSEDLNPKNAKRVDRVVVGLPSDFVNDGVLLVDTPGVGSVYRHNTEVARRYLPEADAVLLVLTSDPPISQSEVDFLHSIRRWSRRLYVVFNKMDYLAPGDLARARAFTEKVLQEALGGAAGVFPISAKRSLEARLAADDAGLARSGFVELRAALERLLAEEKTAVLVEAVSSRACGVVDAAILEAELEQKALSEELQGQESRLADIRARLEEAERRQIELRRLYEGDVSDHLAAMEETLYAFAKDCRSRLLNSLQQLHRRLEKEPAAAVRDRLNQAFQRGVEDGFGQFLDGEEPRWARAFADITSRFLDRTLALVNETLAASAAAFGLKARPLEKPAIQTAPPALWFVVEPVSVWSSGFQSVPTLRLLRPFFWRALRAKAAEAMDVNAGRLRYDYARRVAGAKEAAAQAALDFFKTSLEAARRAASHLEGGLRTEAGARGAAAARAHERLERLKSLRADIEGCR